MHSWCCPISSVGALTQCETEYSSNDTDRRSDCYREMLQAGYLDSLQQQPPHGHKRLGRQIVCTQNRCVRHCGGRFACSHCVGSLENKTSGSPVHSPFETASGAMQAFSNTVEGEPAGHTPRGRALEWPRIKESHMVYGQKPIWVDVGILPALPGCQMQMMSISKLPNYCDPWSPRNCKTCCIY